MANFWTALADAGITLNKTQTAAMKAIGPGPKKGIMGLLGGAVGGIAKGATSGNAVARTATWGAIGGVAGYATSDANNPTNRLLDAGRGAVFGMAASAAVSGIKAAGKWGVNSKGLARAHNMRNQIGPRMQDGRFFSEGLPAGYHGPVRKSGAMTKEFAEQMSYGAQLKQGGFAKLGKGAGQAGMGVLGLAAKHPVAVGVGIVGAGAYGIASPIASSMNDPMQESLGNSVRLNTRYDQQAIAAENMQAGVVGGRFGSAPQMMSEYHRAQQASTAGLVQGLHQGRHG